MITRIDSRSESVYGPTMFEAIDSLGTQKNRKLEYTQKDKQNLTHSKDFLLHCNPVVIFTIELTHNNNKNGN